MLADILHCGNVTEMEISFKRGRFCLDELRVFPMKQDQLEGIMFLVTDVGHDADALAILCETMSIET